MEYLKLTLMAIALVGFSIGFIVQFRLRHHISREKVLAEEDLRTLWKNSIPPRKILTEKGKRLHSLLFIGGGSFIASIICSLLINFLNSSN